MAALVQWYVDPSINANSGSGTSAIPYGDLQWALNAVGISPGRSSANGDQFNIKMGTAEVITGSLSLSVYGTPAEGAPLLLRGYSGTANDGCIAEINCNGVGMWSGAPGFVHHADLEIHSFGNNDGVVFNSGNPNNFYRCNIHKGSSSPSSKALVRATNSRFIGCYFHDAGTNGIALNFPLFVYGCYFANCAVGVQNAAFVCLSSIFVDVNQPFIIGADQAVIIGNTMYSSTALTSSAISNGSNQTHAIILNNIIEGYSGVGGKAINTSAADIFLVGYNTYYNNTTNENFGDVLIDLGSDGTPASSPFVNASANNFGLNTSVTGSIENAFPTAAWFGTSGTTSYLDRGAVQNGAPATDYPIENDVRDGVNYSFGTLNGDLVLPAVSDVKNGVGYGADGVEFTGTYSPAGGAVRISPVKRIGL